MLVNDKKLRRRKQWKNAKKIGRIKMKEDIDKKSSLKPNEWKIIERIHKCATDRIKLLNRYYGHNTFIFFVKELSLQTCFDFKLKLEFIEHIELFYFLFGQLTSISY